MAELLAYMNAILDMVNAVLWHDYVLYVVLGTGILFTIWSGFSQYRALTHGTQVIRGRYDDPNDPGAINHFQALSTALSATVGLGNIAGVAVAIALGGPGAVFWMWMVGLFGMALKTTEVTQSMLYRNTDDPDNPHGGPMWVVSRGLARWSPSLAPLGMTIGGIFCVTIIISAITGGNMFQAWNVAEITNTYFPTVPREGVGIVLAIIVALVIIGGIKRIGAVAGRLVPIMCLLYLLAALLVVGLNLDQVPAMLRMIFVHAFTPTEAAGAFVGGTAGFAFLWGMKRALFSSEAGQGSAPVAHSAAKTDEPVREGVVAGLEPFIDTIVVCTLTTLVILLSGAWNRDAEAMYPADAEMRIVFASEAIAELPFVPAPLPGAEPNHWTLPDTPVPARLDGEDWPRRTAVFAYLELAETAEPRLNGRFPIAGEVRPGRDRAPLIRWDEVELDVDPLGVEPTLYAGNKPRWTLETPPLPGRTTDAKRIHRVQMGPGWRPGETVFMLVHGDPVRQTAADVHRLRGEVKYVEEDDAFHVAWETLESKRQPVFTEGPEAAPNYGVYGDYVGAALTGHAFDRVMPGLGMWLVTLACWLFAISTMIAWSYYGEQGTIYLAGEKAVLPYKIAYCGLIIVATLGFITTEDELDAWTALGTGVMLFANIPIMLIFGAQAMRAYKDYIRRLDSGEMEPPHEAPPITDVVSGEDVE